MILRIDIENFKSIRDRISISFEATKDKELASNYAEIPNIGNVLKTTAFYGANASGKSNVLQAFRAILHLISFSADFKPNQNIGPYEPFKLNAASQNKPVFFEVEFVATDGLKYIYSISFTKSKIEKEELYFFPKNRKVKLFIRESNQYSYGTHYKGEKKSIEGKTLPNQLFLSKAVLDNVVPLIPVFNHFNDNVFSGNNIFQSNALINLDSLYAERLADKNNVSFTQQFNKLICALDTGIEKVESEKVDWESQKIPDNIPIELRKQIQEDYKYRIRTFHKVYDDKNQQTGSIAFAKEEESNGTQSLFILAGIILDTLAGSNILIFDEFEQNLHPHITQFLIQLFHNPVINKNNAQLIFASHDITQLNNEVFRRDQIWFTEKDEFGATSVFSLADFKGVNADIPYDRWYNSGSFGATPIIDDLELLFSYE